MKLCLRVLSGVHAGAEHSIAPPGGIIGRGEGCALHLHDASVSRAHLELRYQQNGWWAYQHSTRSSSRVDGIALERSPTSLRERGVLQLGSISIEYTQKKPSAAEAEPEAPPTMINVRRKLPSIQHTVLPQMTPIRAAETNQSDAPATLILRRPAPPGEQPFEAPPTLIRPPPAKGQSPSPRSIPNSQAFPKEEPSSEVVLDLTQLESERDELRLESEKLRRERDALRLERDKLSADLQRLSQENTKLRESETRRPASPQAPSQLAAQALALLHPFSDSLEQATSALNEGDAARARAILREASFGLADFRDLFESSQS